jgi:hypothetical protein
VRPALRRGAPVAIALAFALVVAGWQAELHWSSRNPTPVATIGPGDTARVGDATYRFDEVVIGEELPSSLPETDVAVAPDGAVLVQLLLTTEIGEDTDPEAHLCSPVAVDGTGREWQRDSDLGYGVAGPEAITCRGPSDDPIRPHEPIQVGFVFLLPADAVDTLAFDVGLAYGQGTLRLVP